MHWSVFCVLYLFHSLSVSCFFFFFFKFYSLPRQRSVNQSWMQSIWIVLFRYFSHCNSRFLSNRSCGSVIYIYICMFVAYRWRLLASNWKQTINMTKRNNERLINDKHDDESMTRKSCRLSKLSFWWEFEYPLSPPPPPPPSLSIPVSFGGKFVAVWNMHMYMRNVASN